MIISTLEQNIVPTPKLRDLRQVYINAFMCEARECGKNWYIYWSQERDIFFTATLVDEELGRKDASI